MCTPSINFVKITECGCGRRALPFACNISGGRCVCISNFYGQKCDKDCRYFGPKLMVHWPYKCTDGNQGVQGFHGYPAQHNVQGILNNIAI